MLLPKKQEVQRQQLEERKMAVSEGMKLARRVDELRATLEKEEASLKKFREESVSIVVSEIRKLQDERNSLKEKIKDYQQTIKLYGRK